MCLSPNSVIWYWAKGSDALQLLTGNVTPVPDLRYLLAETRIRLYWMRNYCCVDSTELNVTQTSADRHRCFGQHYSTDNRLISRIVVAVLLWHSRMSSSYKYLRSVDVGLGTGVFTMVPWPRPLPLVFPKHRNAVAPGLAPWVPLRYFSASLGIQALSVRPSGFLQCFDTVGLVIWPVKIVPNMPMAIMCLVGR